MKTVSPIAEVPFSADSNVSGISWAAVIGGAFVAAAFWLTLTILGIGLGLTALTPWSGAGASSDMIGASAIIWLIMTQVIASGLGGYLAGRLRLKWVTVPSDEVYFRDTAHGILVWAVGVVIAAAFLGSTFSMIVGSGINLAPMAAATGAAPAMPGSVFKAAPGSTAETPGGGETAPGAPGSPVVGATPTPGPQSMLTKEDVDRAREAAAKASIWIFIALLIGAFCAAIAALIGGRQRDSVVYYDYDVETGVRST